MDPLSSRSVLYGIPTTPPATSDYNEPFTTLSTTIRSESDSTALPSHPNPLQRPIYICRHTCGPLPVNNSFLTKPHPSSSTPSSSSKSPLLVFLHPCHTCHYIFTESLVADIFNRFKRDMDYTQAKLENVEKMLEKGYKPEVARIRDALLKHKTTGMAMRRAEIKEAWDGFKAVWGPWGKGKEADGCKAVWGQRGKGKEVDVEVEERGRGRKREDVDMDVDAMEVDETEVKVEERGRGRGRGREGEERGRGRESKGKWKDMILRDF